MQGKLQAAAPQSCRRPSLNMRGNYSRRECCGRNEFTNYFFLDRKVDTQQDRRDWKFFPQVRCRCGASMDEDSSGLHEVADCSALPEA